MKDETALLGGGRLDVYSSGRHFLTTDRFVSSGNSGLLLWNLEDGSNRLIRRCIAGKQQKATVEGRSILVADVSYDRSTSSLSWMDLEDGSAREITSHGNRVCTTALDPAGRIAVTGDWDGIVRVGPVTGEEPHLLFGHRLEVSSVAISPDGRWIASGSQDGTIRLWPMPDVDEPPFHTLPYQELLERLRSLTNMRVVADESSSIGYRLEVGPFPGWEKVPVW
jgi:WD40 repeat protein